MVKVYKNEKGFTVFEIDSKTYLEKLGHLGGKDTCDKCCNQTDVIYYVPLLDQHLCRNCYKEWLKNADDTLHTEYVEVRNENRYKRLFNI